MLRTAGWLALPRRTLSAGFDGGISPSFQFVAAQLLGGWVPTETGLSPASHSRLLWTHNSSALRQALHRPANEIRRILNPRRGHSGCPRLGEQPGADPHAGRVPAKRGMGCGAGDDLAYPTVSPGCLAPRAFSLLFL